MKDYPVVAAFRECGCFVCEFALVVEGHHQLVAFDTANWPVRGWETRIVASSQVDGYPRGCDLCLNGPGYLNVLRLSTDYDKWKRLSDMREGVIDAVIVMRRLTRK